MSKPRRVTLVVEQHTDYPTSGKVVIKLHPSEPVEFTLRLRLPRWCTKPAHITINSKAINDGIVHGTFFGIKRQWKSGDEVEINMPMEWRIIKGRQYQKPLGAVMRGPVVFCLSVERNESLRHMELLHRLRIDPESLGEPVRDDAVRPNGLACEVKGLNPFVEERPSEPTNTVVVLTEFSDPESRAAYFHLIDDKMVIDDELYNIIV